MKDLDKYAQRMTTDEFNQLCLLYDKATNRKMFILAVTSFMAFTTILALVVYQLTTQGLPNWMFFIGCGASVIVYGVVAIFAQFNDNVYDILTAIRPDLSDQ